MQDPPIWPDDQRPRSPQQGSGSWGPPPPPPRPDPRDYPQPSEPYYPPTEPYYPPADPRYPAPDPHYGQAPGGYPPQQPAYTGYGQGGYPPQAYPPQGPRYTPPAAPVPPPERVQRERSRDRGHRGGWSLPVEHIVLAAGIMGMFLSLSQPWGVDASGHPILLSAYGYKAAYYSIGGLTVLGGLLVLLNRRMGCLAFAGCLTLFLVPLIVAASVGGIEILTQLHVIPHLTSANIKGENRGFFLWWGGLAVTVVGLLFEVITHRRKGLIGI